MFIPLKIAKKAAKKSVEEGLEKPAKTRVDDLVQATERFKGCRGWLPGRTIRRSMSYFLMKTNHFDLFEEAAKFRAMRRIWATRLRERYDARVPESHKCKVLGHSGGSQMTRERPELNIARTTLACLAGALGGIQLIGLRTMDEVFGIPTEKSEMIAIGTQHVVAHETGVPDVVHPLGGSYYVEALTKALVDEAQKLIDEVEKMGGMTKAVETGWPKLQVEEAAAKTQARIDLGETVP